MRTYFKKSNKEEVDLIRDLAKKGLSVSEIARRLHRDRTVCYYWLRKANQLPIKKKQDPARHQKVQAVKKAIVKKETEEAERERKTKEGLCFFCGRKKEDSRWLETHFCGKSCWQREYEKKCPLKLVW